MRPPILMSDWLNATRPARVLGRLLANRFRNRRNRPSTLDFAAGNIGGALVGAPGPRIRALGRGTPGGSLVPLNQAQNSLVRDAANYAIERLASRVEGGQAPSPEQGRDILNRIIRRRTDGGIAGSQGR